MDYTLVLRRKILAFLLSSAKGGQIGTLCIWAKNSWNYKENKRIFPTYLLRKFLAHVKARENSLSLTVNPVAKKQ